MMFFVWVFTAAKQQKFIAEKKHIYSEIISTCLDMTV